MKSILTILLVLACLISAQVPAAAADVEEFPVAIIAGSNTIQLSDTYRHFAISVPEDLAVRFIVPLYDSAGDPYDDAGTPAGNPAVPLDSGPHPDAGDTTMTAFVDLTWNVYNDISAKKIHIHGATGPGTVTIKAKK